MKVALFRSENRYDAFLAKLRSYDCDVVELSFDNPDWHLQDYEGFDLLIYFPSFLGSSSRPDSLMKVKNNLAFLSGQYPELAIFPDPGLYRYYSDKYEQFLFLTKHDLPVPKTMAVSSAAVFDDVEREIGYPCVVKNRYGAGGDYVYRVETRSELEGLVRFANLNFSGWLSGSRMVRHLVSRRFLRGFFGPRRAEYPFLSLPLLVQEFIEHDKDLKLVVGDYAVVEGHWRRKASSSMWKMNIDGGGVGEWSEIPEEIQELGVALAKRLEAKWLNIDLIFKNDAPLISEFSPVWHHYGYEENERFIYSDSYNLALSPKDAADLEELIVSSYVREQK